MTLNATGELSQLHAGAFAQVHSGTAQYTGIYKGLYVELEPQVLCDGFNGFSSLRHHSGFKLNHGTSAD